MATFHFEVKEIGQRLPDAELDEIKRSRYGDVRGRQVNLAETPAQLMLEAASLRQVSSKKVVSETQQNQTQAKPSIDVRDATKTLEAQVDDSKKSGGAGGDGLNKVSSAPPKISSPVKQREYRRPDGRKRIIPEAVGVPVQQDNKSGGIQSSNAIDFPSMSSDQKKDNNGDAAPECVRENSVRGVQSKHTDSKERTGVTARATISDSLVIEKVPLSAGKDANIIMDHSGNLKMSSSLATCSSVLSIRVFDKKAGEYNEPICLEARPKEHAANDIIGAGNTSMLKETVISCTKGSRNLWSDRVSGKVTVLAGNANFWAVGCEDGCLQVITGHLIFSYSYLGALRLSGECYGRYAYTMYYDGTARLCLDTRSDGYYMRLKFLHSWQ